MDRKAFNFYRSYYDVALLLPDEERGEFLMAILHAQFTGEIIKPKSTMAALAFAGQLHSVEKQLEGFKHGKNTPPRKGGLKGVSKESLPQEQEKEQEKEEYTIDFGSLLSYINTKTKRKFKTINTTVKNKYRARLNDGYSKVDIVNAIDNAVNSEYHKGNNYQYLTPEFFSRAETLDKYSQVGETMTKEEKNWDRINNF